MSYLAVYVEEFRRRGEEPRNMLFAAKENRSQVTVRRRFVSSEIDKKRFFVDIILHAAFL